VLIWKRPPPEAAARLNESRELVAILSTIVRRTHEKSKKTKGTT
jgi:hypothetical protein